MKKSVRIFAVVMLAMVSVTANAQLGVKVGYVNASTKFKGGIMTASPASQNGVTAGLSYDIGLPVKGLSIRPGIDYTYIGDKSIFSGFSEDEDFSSMKDRDHSISVPVDLKYAYDINDNFSIYGFAGPRFVVGVSSIIKVSAEGQTGTINLYTGKTKINGNTSDKNPEPVFSRFDVQLGLGAGVRLNPVFIETGYNWGLVNRLKKDISEGTTMKRGIFFVNLGFLF